MKYDIYKNETYVVIEFANVPEFEPCYTCDGQSKVGVIIKECARTVQCPDCETGRTFKGNKRKWAIRGTMFSIMECSPSLPHSYRMNSLLDYRHDEEFSAYEDDIFTTLREAQVECNRRNMNIEQLEVNKP